ncbi:MAG: hypothetical protein EBS86_12440 [Crocinitomicaceae bacterium]|nr:hypothetical protein [Crocinitomicaceae bacterium]
MSSFEYLFYNNTLKNIVGFTIIIYITFYKYYINKCTHLQIAKLFIDISFKSGILSILTQIFGYLFNYELCFAPNYYIIQFLYNRGYLPYFPWLSIKMTIINVVIISIVHLGFSYILTLIAFPTGIPEDL